MEGAYFFGEHLRWNLGWSNPNPAGAFVAMFLPWFWGIGGLLWSGWKPLGNRPIWGLALLLLMAAEFWVWFLLFKTYSRGALVATGAAGLLFLFGIGFGGFRRREGIRWREVLAFSVPRSVGIAVLLQATGFFARVDPRFVSQDASAGNRLALWKGGLQMIAEAPWSGWGKGQSGSGFMHWYQKFEAKEAYAGMVNSYLHVGVERGLLLLTGAVTVALAVWLLSWTVSRRAFGDEAGGANFRKGEAMCVGSNGVALVALGAGCSWVVFLVANFFSTLWIFGNLWWQPAVAGISILGLGIGVFRGNFLKEAGIRLRMAAAAAFLCSCGLWLVGGAIHDEVRISKNGGEISCIGGEGNKGRVLLLPDKSVLGETWGKEVRRFAAYSGASVHVPAGEGEWTGGRPEWIIACGKRVVEGLEVQKRFPEARLILVHPLGKPEARGGAGEVSVVLPSFDTHGTGRRWKIFCKQNSWGWVVSPGVGQDIRLVWPGMVADALQAVRSERDVPGEAGF